jgi:hypothetical protein
MDCVIFVPNTAQHLYDSAKELARRCSMTDLWRFKYEYLFTWNIPTEYVTHAVSVETLMQRGLDMKDYFVDGALPSTHILRREFEKVHLNRDHGGYEIGLGLGSLARCFGARAPVCQIAGQLLRDCLNARSTDWDAQEVDVEYWDGVICCLDFRHFRNVDDGINTALLDWWLADTEFEDKYEICLAAVSEMQKRMKAEHDYWSEVEKIAINHGL